MTRFGLLSIVLLGVPLGAGCLSVPEGEPPMCTSNSDCDTTSGEICDEGLCYGNPPPGPFAAVISVPSEHSDDLSAVELHDLPIASDGWIGTVQLDAPVSFTASLRARCEAPLTCESGSTFGATVTVTRPGRFPGGPSFRTAITVNPGDDSFQLSLPRSSDQDPPFTVTVMPDGRDDAPGATPTAAQLLPPLRTSLTLTSNSANQVIELGGSGLKTVSGYIQNNAGGGIGGYRVVAMGRWEPSAPPSEISTIDYTGSDGKFTLVLAQNVVGPVEVVARPYAPNLVLPALHLEGVTTAASSSDIRLALPPSLGAAVDIAVPVKAVDGSGGIQPIAGARVTVSSVLDPILGNDFATFKTEATTDANGVAKLKLLDGDGIRRTYRLSILPPASATAGVVFDDPFELAAVSEIVLPTRVAIRGVVYNHDGEPVKDVAITARPSLRFLWSLPPVSQSFVASIPSATAVSLDTGEFVVFVDPYVAETWGHYDLVFEPTAKSRAPSWLETVELPRSSTTTTVTRPITLLPDAAFVRGEVVNFDGQPVVDADVKLFRVEPNTSLCTMVRYAPPSCPIPAPLVGRGTSDADGVVRLTLPRP